MSKRTDTPLRPSPARGQAWKRHGDTILFRVMAVADGWVLARYKGCTPFTMFVKDLQRNCTRLEAFDSDLGKPS